MSCFGVLCLILDNLSTVLSILLSKSDYSSTRLINKNRMYFFLYFLFQEDIFQQPGLRSDFAEIRDCLDTGMPDSLRILMKCYMTVINWKLLLVLERF